MPLPLQPVPQHYAWGGDRFLADFLGTSFGDRPTAELWLGDHPKGPAPVVGEDETLANRIAADPKAILGPGITERYGARLPFLLKVLDVRQMLSIQVHPDKGTAEAGFAREEENGPDRGAPDRNYRDDNHKPELGLAVTDFYLLHGFRTPDAIKATLAEVPGWAYLSATLDREGVAGLYEHVMRADQETVDKLLQPLVDKLATAGEYDRSQPEFWACRAVEQYSEGGHHDRGMFSIFWFNLVHLRPGEAIFQDAGIPHAYLEGRCIELMANSDNVLRGGLTPKHIDVDELLLNVRFEPVEPHIITPVADGTAARYPVPVADFSLRRLELQPGQQHELTAGAGPLIVLLWEGQAADSASGLQLSAIRRSWLLPRGETVSIVAENGALLYLASTGDGR